jgi:FdhD protein
MMATPANLEDFAVGFSLNEGIVQSREEFTSLETVEVDQGIELRMWLASARGELINQRRRQIAGPTGCGLCGVESIAETMRPVSVVALGGILSGRQIMNAMQSMAPMQEVNLQTRAVHAAALWTPSHGIECLREDVGRHNALDKLRGALALASLCPREGVVLLTSRVSVEMVQKTAMLGPPIMVAVSAPTALAVRIAEEAGITLIAVARADSFEVFTHPGRIVLDLDGAKRKTAAIRETNPKRSHF